MKVIFAKIMFIVGIGGITISIGEQSSIIRLIGLWLSAAGILLALDYIIKNIIKGRE